MGKLSALLERQLGVKTRSRFNPIVSTVGLTAVRIAPNNADRVAVSVINLSATDIVIAFDNQVSLTRGIVVPAGGGNCALSYLEDLELVGYEIWAISSAAGCPIYVTECIAQ